MARDLSKKYRVVFLGLLEGTETFAQKMASLGFPLPKVEGILEKAPVTLKKGLSLKEAREWADTVQYAGGRVNVQEEGTAGEGKRIRHTVSIRPLESFTMCSQCGHKQPKARACVKCGSLLCSE